MILEVEYYNGNLLLIEVKSVNFEDSEVVYSIDDSGQTQFGRFDILDGEIKSISALADKREWLYTADYLKAKRKQISKEEV